MTTVFYTTVTIQYDNIFLYYSYHPVQLQFLDTTVTIKYDYSY